MEAVVAILPPIYETPSSSSPSKRALQRGVSVGGLTTKREKDMTAFNDAIAQVKDNMTDSQKAHTLLKQGRLAMEAGNYISAIDIFSEGISFTPTIVTLYTSRATCYKNIHKHTEAYYDYSFAIRLEPDNANLFCFRGLVLSKLKRDVMAVEDMDEAIRLEPLAYNYYCRGTVYADSMKYECAMVDFDSAIADSNITPDLLMRVLYRKALTLFDLGSFSEAVPVLQQIIGIDTNHLSGRVLYGKTLKNLGEFKLADDQLSIVIALEPQVASHYVERGDIRFQSRQKDLIVDSIADFDESIEIYRTSCRTERSSRPAVSSASADKSSRETKSSSNSSANPNVEALRVEQQQRQVNGTKPLLADALYRLAQSKLMQDEVQEHTKSALADINEALALCPGEDNYQLLQAVCYLRSRDIDNAKAALEPLVNSSNSSPYNERAHYHYSNCLRLEGHKKEAVRRLTYIIAKASARSNYDEGQKHSHTVPLSRVFEMRGIILQEMHSHELALKDFSKSISLDATKADILVLRGACHCKLGNYELALEDYTLAEARGVEDMFSLFVARGLVHRMMRNYPRASADFDNAAAHNKNGSSNYYEVRITILKGLSLIDLEKYSGALKYFVDAEGVMGAIVCAHFNGYILGEINSHAHQLNLSNKMAREAGSRDRYRRSVVSTVPVDVPALEATDDRHVIFRIFHENIKIISKTGKAIMQKYYRVLWTMYYHQSLVYYRMKNFEHAAATLKLCSSQEWRLYECDEFSYGCVLFFLGISLRNIGALEESEGVLAACQATAWVAAARNLMLVNFAMGKVCQMRHKYSEAVDYYTRTIELDPSNAHAFFRRAWTHKALRDYMAAGEDFEIAKGMRPHDPNFSLEYKQIQALEFVVVEQEPDSMEVFPTILQISGAFV